MGFIVFYFIFLCDSHCSASVWWENALKNPTRQLEKCDEASLLFSHSCSDAAEEAKTHQHTFIVSLFLLEGLHLFSPWFYFIIIIIVIIIFVVVVVVIRRLPPTAAVIFSVLEKLLLRGRAPRDSVVKPLAEKKTNLLSHSQV